MSAFLMPLLGGVLIGVASALILFAHGRVAGICGIAGRMFDRVLPGAPQTSTLELPFLLGLISAGLAAVVLARGAIGVPVASWPTTVVAGLLVGFGARLGNGCTSGHGVCGIGRGSRRSIVATVVFMAAAMITVFVARHLVSP